MDQKQQDYIAKYVADMHSLVEHGLQPFSHQLKESALREHPEARQAIQAFQADLQRHESALDSRLKALGASPTTLVQDTAATVAGIGAGLYNKVRSEAVSKSLRDDYSFLSLCNVSWMMLMTTARSLGDHDTEELAEQGYRDTARMVIQIDQVMPTVIVQELKQDGFAAQDVSAWAQALVHRAWNREPAGSSV